MENHHPQNRKRRVVSSHRRPHLPNNDTPPTEPRGEARRREEKGDWRNWTRGAEGVGWRWGSTRRLGRLTYVRIVPRELTGEIKRGRGRGKWENTPADTEADAANDSVRGNLLVLSVLATWGPTYFESRTCTRFHSLVSRLPAPIPHRCFYSIQFDRSSFPSVQANVSPIEQTLPTNGRQIKKRKDGKVYKRIFECQRIVKREGKKRRRKRPSLSPSEIRVHRKLTAHSCLMYGV